MSRRPRSEVARASCGGLALGVLVCTTPRAGAAPVAAQDETHAPVPGESPEPAPPLFTGQLLSRYRGRFTEETSDHDLYSTLDLTVTDPERRWSGSVLARAAWDVDGSDGHVPETFDILDTYSHQLQGQLFHAYLDVASSAFELLRFGRQPIYETPVTVVLDGLRAELAPSGERRLALGAYAGVGEHLYESSSDGDFVLGGFGSARAWQGAEVRADWMHLEDARLGVDHEDDLLGFVLSQDLLREETSSRVEARFTSLEGDGRDLRVLVNHVDAPGRWSLSGSAYRLLKTQRSLAAPLDPFSDTLFELFPYSQLGLSLTKDWEAFALLSGADVRRVSETDDEGDYNRDFERYYVTGTLPDVLTVSFSLTGEVWRATDTDFETWGAALAREFEGGWGVLLGSHYALYEYDLSSAEERDHVRSTSLDLRWKASAARRWALRYEFEHGDEDDFQQLELDYAWSF